MKEQESIQSIQRLPFSIKSIHNLIITLTIMDDFLLPFTISLSHSLSPPSICMNKQRSEEQALASNPRCPRVMGIGIQ